ncbi:MAG TPA: acyl-ACP--UDP-N-acetylglucosamine O-acyltransferase [bacterium]|nr:acyl-ACP--UDP-N-acetylglucosamine O-acyltransferase [bacterium]
MIDKTAIVNSGAELAEDVKVGPYAIIESGVEIGAGTEVHAHAVVREGTRLGKNCRVHSGAVLGGEPQDVKFGGEESFLIIGDGTILREGFTAHRGSGEQSETRIGSGCMLMATAHVGHNCVVGNGVVMANAVNLGGFVQVGDRAFVGGLTGVHQFTRIGAFVMVGGGSVVLEDIPPYMLVTGGYRPPVCGLNRIGLMRAGFDQDTRRAMHKAYRLLYKSGLSVSEAVERIKTDLQDIEEIGILIDFLESKSDRGICRGRED